MSRKIIKNCCITEKEFNLLLDIQTKAATNRFRVSDSQIIRWGIQLVAQLPDSKFINLCKADETC